MPQNSNCQDNIVDFGKKHNQKLAETLIGILESDEYYLKDLSCTSEISLIYLYKLAKEKYNPNTNEIVCTPAIDARELSDSYNRIITANDLMDSLYDLSHMWVDGWVDDTAREDKVKSPFGKHKVNRYYLTANFGEGIDFAKKHNLYIRKMKELHDEIWND